MSERNLTRLFKRTTGITIGAYSEKLKVERAIHLLSKKNKVEIVAQLCGFKSSDQLRTLLKKHKGVLPTDISSLK
jgi:transcriptional regulator GlxA family with amidase domain